MARKHFGLLATAFALKVIYMAEAGTARYLFRPTTCSGLLLVPAYYLFWSTAIFAWHRSVRPIVLSGQEISQDFPMDIGQTKIAPAVTINQASVVDP
jgi:hypothetical protein